MRRVLVLVENNSVPSDTRVWAECSSLRRAGWDVTVICPKGIGRDTEAETEHDGVAIHRFDLAPSSGGLDYAREYGLALLRTHRLVRKVSHGKQFDVAHACSPPDFLLSTVVGLRRRGTATVFDHHDLSPELYQAKFGGGRTVVRSLKAIERIGFRLADVVIATNESFRVIAIGRGRKEPEDVFVVRNGPDTDVFRPTQPDDTVRSLGRHVIGYVGLIGSQDGVEEALEALGHLRSRRADWHAVFVGDGDALPAAQEKSRSLGLDEFVSFIGYVDDRERLVRLIAACDVCISPEPRNPLNELSTLIKVAEYMAVGRPIVAFDLVETMRTAKDAATYAERDDPVAFADAISRLLDDPAERERMGSAGRRRAVECLGWNASESALLAAYRRAVELAEGRHRTHPRRAQQAQV